MDKTLGATIILGLFGVGASLLGNEAVGWVCLLGAIGLLILLRKPEWAQLRPFGRGEGKGNAEGKGKPFALVSARPGARAEIQDLTLLGSGGSSVGVAANGDAEIDLLRVGIKGFNKGIDAHDAAKVRATDSQLHGPEPAGVPKMGRNRKCPCGSGKRYKNCHGKPA